MRREVVIAGVVLCVLVYALYVGNRILIVVMGFCVTQQVKIITMSYIVSIQERYIQLLNYERERYNNNEET